MNRQVLAQVVIACLGWLGVAHVTDAQTIFEADFDTTFADYGYSFGYAGEGDSSCTGLPDSNGEVVSTFDVSSPPAAIATFDTSAWDFPVDACYTYAGWGLGVGFNVPATTRFDSGNLADYTVTFDTAVMGYDVLLGGLESQLYFVLQSPDTNGDGLLEDYRLGFNDPLLNPFLTDAPQTLTYSLADLPFVSGDLDFSIDFAQILGVQLIVQPFGDAVSIGVDADNAVTVDNFLFEGPTVTLPSGDFNGDMLFDCTDVNDLVAEIVAGTNTADFDMNGDGSVDVGDLDSWLAAAGAANLPSGNPYLPGDANLDGSVDVSDFNVWNGSKFLMNSGWCGGDFNADGSTDVSDFNVWNENKFQASGLATVPEPTMVAFLVGAMICWPRRRR